MDVIQTSYFTVVDKKSQTRFICCARRKNGVLNVCLTDAADVWSSEFTTDTLDQLRHKFALKSTDDILLNLRVACSRGKVSVVIHDSSADLCVGSGPGDLSVTLNSLEGPQAREELKELLFRMADSLTQTDSVSPSISPVKAPQRRPTDFEPRQQNGAPSVTLKKRLPGASLINPGAKKKLRATGVAFDDVDED
ncbi:protein PAXX isoform X2 [Notolabrus celidotus]|uniref:protein PAXX isoform X2 n=1 Tax=Notolabrus celidotus TaxID=1203425 RepID=UPI00148F7C9E|nr:protein PAXX isoform X2 [Notolabrus celidotus]